MTRQQGIPLMLICLDQLIGLIVHVGLCAVCDAEDI